MKTLRLLGVLGLALGASLAAPVLPASLSASVPLAGAAPAAAAGCGGSGGVTVVVDYKGQAGRGASEGCAAGSGGTADRLFTAVGTGMRYASSEPGFVCRVNNVPESDPCVNASPSNAYWGLFWSTGEPGSTWTYASSGVRSLRVPAGGKVAWAWQDGGSPVGPGAPAARPTPSPAPDNGGGGSGRSSDNLGGGGSSSPDSPSASPDATDSPSEDADRGAGAGSERVERGDREAGAAKRSGEKRGAGDGKAEKRKAGGRNGKDDRNGRGRDGRGDRDAGTVEESESSPLTDADGDTEQVSSASEEDPSGLPTWVPLAVIAVLGLGGVGAVLQRRRTRPSP